MISQTRRTAVHEAGHAVFHVLTKTPFQCAVVKPNGAGNVLGIESDSDVESQPVPNGDLSDLVIALAGEMAEWSILGDCDDAGLAEDRKKVNDALGGLAINMAHGARLEQRCRSAVEALFQRLAIRASVELVAEKLRHGLKLTATEVEELVPAEARLTYADFPGIETT